MKKTFKKILSLILAFAVTLGVCTFAFAENDCDDGDIMLPPTEDIEVSVVYAPVTSRIVYNQKGPFYDGVILKITYCDGTSEILKVKRTENGYYKAGDFNVDGFLFFLEAAGQISNYGIKTPGLHVSKHENGMLYEGSTGFAVISIPNIFEFFNCIRTLIKIYSASNNP